MLSKINRQTCRELYPTFPSRSYDYGNDEEICTYPTVYKSYLLTIPAKTFRGLTSLLGNELLKLAKVLNSPKLVFLGDIDTPWRYQKNSYPPAKSALEYLTDQKVGKQFNGALAADEEEIKIFTRHLCWLTRCNAALPYIYFIDLGERIVGNICRYGNLHKDVMDSKTDQLLKHHISGSLLQFTDTCYNKFSISATAGRQTVV